MLLVVTFDLSEADLATFEKYEAMVLPRLQDYEGRMHARLRSRDGRLELHVISFADPSALEQFRADDVRQAAAPLLAASGAKQAIMEVEDLLSPAR